MIESNILPAGALQLICGGVGDLLDHLMSQDVVTFTGSAATGRKLKAHPSIIDESIRFNMEADSLNFSMLGPDAAPGTEEFDLFIKEVSREMTTKAGQKCTAIRRTLVPEAMVEDVIKALAKRLDGATLGDPAVEGVRMGPLATKDQVTEVREERRGAHGRARSWSTAISTTSRSSAPSGRRAPSSPRCCSTAPIRSSGASRTTSRPSVRSTP